MRISLDALSNAAHHSIPASSALHIVSHRDETNSHWTTGKDRLLDNRLSNHWTTEIRFTCSFLEGRSRGGI